MTLTISTNEADAAAAEAITGHHAQMAGAVALHTDSVLDAAANGDSGATMAARDELHAWCKSELLPHALAEEEVLYAAARTHSEGRLLIDAMVVEHRSLAALVAELASDSGVRVAAAAHALRTLLTLHIDKENDYIVPLLASAADVSLGDLLSTMHERLSAAADPDQAAVEPTDSHECGCHEPADPSYPELDARMVPHAIRHATVFGALDAVRTGRGLVLIAPHDPLPLLAQLEKRAPGAFSVSYLQRGPEAWRLSVVRN